MKVVPFINMKLPLQNRIKIYDNFMWEEFGYKQFPIADKFNKEGFDGYPFCYIDGLIVEPAQKELLIPFFKGLFRGEFNIQ